MTTCGPCRPDARDPSDWIRAPAPSTEVLEALEELKSAGYRGEVDEYSQRLVRAILEKAPALQRAGRQWLLGALIALGMRHDQVERLPAMPGVITKLHHAKTRLSWTSRDW